MCLSPVIEVRCLMYAVYTASFVNKLLGDPPGIRCSIFRKSSGGHFGQGLKPEAHRAKSRGWGAEGGGSALPNHQIESLGSAVSSPVGSRAKLPRAFEAFYFSGNMYKMYGILPVNY